MPQLAVNGIELFYEREGQGTPLMLIPGLASDSQSWEPVRPGLVGAFDLILPDNRGTGRTLLGDQGVTIEAMARDCVALLDALGLEKAHLLGHSMGAVIAARVAQDHPGRVNRLVLASSSASISPRTWAALTNLLELREAGVPELLFYKALFPWLFAPAFFSDPVAVERAAELSRAYPFAQPARAMRQQIEGAQAYDGMAGLERITAPVLSLCGAKDLLTPPDEVRASLAGIPEIRFEVIADAAHSLHWDKPDTFLGHVNGFLLG